jgi:hypothetical protein
MFCHEGSVPCYEDPACGTEPDSVESGSTHLLTLVYTFLNGIPLSSAPTGMLHSRANLLNTQNYSRNCNNYEKILNYVTSDSHNDSASLFWVSLHL